MTLRDSNHANISGTQPREWKIAFSRKFTGDSSNERSNCIVIDARTAGPGRIREPGPASLGKATPTFTDSFAGAGEFGSDLSIVVSVSSEKDNLCSEDIALWTGSPAYDRFKISPILSGHSDCDWLRFW